MRLEDLYQNFMQLPAEEQELFVRRYREKRARDLEAEPIKKRGRSKGTSSSSRAKLSPDEKALLKSLGLTLKELRALAGTS